MPHTPEPETIEVKTAQAVDPAAICSACGGSGYEENPYHSMPGPLCKVCQVNPLIITPNLETSDVRWEYEDQLPEMSDDEFTAIFKASRVDGVRLYPYVEDSNGNRIWITHLPEPWAKAKTSTHEPAIAVHNVFSEAIPGAFGVGFLRRLLGKPNK